MILVFIASGAYMHFRFNHLRGMEPAQRMLFRASHIYLLLIGAVNVAFGAGERHARGLQLALSRIASVLALWAPLPLIVAFCVEPLLTPFHRGWTRAGLYSVFAAAVLQTIANFLPRSVEDR